MLNTIQTLNWVFTGYVLSSRAQHWLSDTLLGYELTTIWSLKCRTLTAEIPRSKLIHTLNFVGRLFCLKYLKGFNVKWFHFLQLSLLTQLFPTPHTHTHTHNYAMALLVNRKNSFIHSSSVSNSACHGLLGIWSLSCIFCFVCLFVFHSVSTKVCFAWKSQEISTFLKYSNKSLGNCMNFQVYLIKWTASIYYIRIILRANICSPSPKSQHSEAGR